MPLDGPRWFEKSDTNKRFSTKAKTLENQGPDLWTRCPSCHEMVFNETLENNQNVCTVCGHHFRLGALERLRYLCDPDSLVFHDENLVSTDILGFVDSKPYSTRIEQSCTKTGRNDAFVAVSASITGIELEIGTFDFRYMGGSMGSVVGEMITRMIERATERKRPCLIISASGGARMQEGVLSLMQMAKTSAALTRLKDEAGMPYISILTHPTTGGVAASFAMLGDLILAEPEALIGFAGPRVIKETIGQDLPEGFQTSEYLLNNGMLDAIVPRGQMRETLGQLLRQLMKLPALNTEEVTVNEGNRAVAAGGPVLVKPARGNGK
jgi:acetyl-CoA carboxylase carboxyl transferase subunit beta